MADSVQPHRWQPTRLRHPWDSPGKNTGVGCHFLLQCMKVKSESEDAQSCPALRDPMDCSLPGSSIHGIFQARVLELGAIAFSDSILCSDLKRKEMLKKKKRGVICIHIADSFSCIIETNTKSWSNYTPKKVKKKINKIALDSLSVKVTIFKTKTVKYESIQPNTYKIGKVFPPMFKEYEIEKSHYLILITLSQFWIIQAVSFHKFPQDCCSILSIKVCFKIIKESFSRH